MAPVRVFHCDDSESFRLLVREMLRDDEAVELVGEAGTIDEALGALPGARADVVLVDLLDRNSEDVLIGRLRAVAPDPSYVVYSGTPVRAGEAAEGFLHKSADFSELGRVIAEAAAHP